jgi:hypothetical protein
MHLPQTKSVHNVLNELTVDFEKGGVAGPLAGNVGRHAAVVGRVLQPGLQHQQVPCKKINAKVAKKIMQILKNANRHPSINQCSRNHARKSTYEPVELTKMFVPILRSNFQLLDRISTVGQLTNTGRSHRLADSTGAV